MRCGRGGPLHTSRERRGGALRSRIPPLDLLANDVTGRKDADRRRCVLRREVERERWKLQGTADAAVQGEQQKHFSSSYPGHRSLVRGGMRDSEHEVLATQHED